MAAARRGRLQVPWAVQVGIFMQLWEQYSLATSQTKNKSLNHTAKAEKMLHAVGPSICLSLETNTPCLVLLPKLSGGLAHAWALAVSQEGCSLPATSRAPVAPHSCCPHHGGRHLSRGKPRSKNPTWSTRLLQHFILPLCCSPGTSQPRSPFIWTSQGGQQGRNLPKLTAGGWPQPSVGSTVQGQQHWYAAPPQLPLPRAPYEKTLNYTQTSMVFFSVVQSARQKYKKV